MAGFLPYLFGRAEAPNLPYNPPQIPERFLTQAPVPEMQMRDVQQGLVGAKSDWDNADKSMQWWTKQLETPDLTDEDKQKINANIEGWGKMRDAAANAATDIRAQADAMGIDVSDYGAGKTLQDANRAYNTYRNTAMRDFLRLPSVRELEESRYTELLNRGVSPRMAKSIIGDERAGRQEDFLKRVTEGVMTYGVNPDGQTLNPFGLSMMQKLDPANPELTARLFAGGFAMPKDMFSEDRADNRVRMTNDATAQRQADQIAFNRWNTTFSNDQTNKRLEKTLEHQSKENALERGSREHIALLNATLRRVSGGSKDSEDKLLAEVASLVDLGLTPEQARELVLRRYYNNAFAGLKDDKKILEDQEKFKNFVSGQFSTIEYYLETKNYKTAKELIGQFRESIQNPENKYSELAGAANTRYMLDKLKQYEDVADGNDTLQKVKELEANVTGDSMGSLQRTNQYHRNTGTTNDAKETGEAKAIEERRKKTHEIPVTPKEDAVLRFTKYGY